MIILGVILLLLWYLILPVHIIYVVGVILVAIGVLLFLLGTFGPADRYVGGRRYWY